MKIYIPTKGRITNDRTWKYLPGFWKDRATLVCPSNEVEAHIKAGRNAIACDLQGISAVRQWIIDNADTDHILMTDDDHDFYIRKSPEAWNLRYMDQNDVYKLMDDIALCLEGGEAFVGLSSRQGNNNMYPHTTKRNLRNCNMYAVNRKILKHHGIRFDALPLMEDFYVQLSLLTKGISTLTITDRAWAQPTSNAKGGCSTYRNKELQEQAATMLKEAFPDFVKLVTKQNKSGWEGMENRTDVIISWKKAYESGCKKPLQKIVK